jgi:hypothetical protein
VTIPVTDRSAQQLGNATVVTDNPAGVVYTATFPDKAFFTAAYPNGGNLKGDVSAVASPDGKGVLIKLKLSNLPPKDLGPFSMTSSTTQRHDEARLVLTRNTAYHLHVAPVPENGNCTATLAHLDPFIRGEDTACNSSFPETCQVGDLSGKWGKITSDPYEITYHDLYASTKEGIGAFFGNRSIVVHYPNKTRISCANFKLAQGATTLPSTGDSCSGNITAPPSMTSSGPKPTQTFATAGAGMLQTTVWGVGAAAMLVGLNFML